MGKNQLPNFGKLVSWVSLVLHHLWIFMVDFTYQRVPFTSSTKIDESFIASSPWMACDSQANWIRPDFSGRGPWLFGSQPVISMWLPKAWGYCKEKVYKNLKKYTGSTINRGFWSLGNRLQMWWVATKALIMMELSLSSDGKRSLPFYTDIATFRRRKPWAALFKVWAIHSHHTLSI